MLQGMLPGMLPGKSMTCGSFVGKTINCALTCTPETVAEMLQLKKGLRLDCLRQPFKQALVTAARIGAEGVEINGRTDARPREMSRTAIRHLAKILSDLNLKVSAIHFPTRRGYDDISDLERRIEATKAAMSLAYELGCNVVVNRIGRVPEDPLGDRWQTMVQALTDLGNHGQKAGAWLAAQTGDDDGQALKGLIDALPPMSLGVDFDPAGLMINGFSASEAIRQLSAHVMSFRARDAVRDLSQGRGVEVQLGRGSIVWADLLGALEEQNYCGYITVDRQTDSNPVSACGQALEYLTNLFE
jgi:sugar phosphate isomerase/epimerase